MKTADEVVADFELAMSCGGPNDCPVPWFCRTCVAGVIEKARREALEAVAEIITAERLMCGDDGCKHECCSGMRYLIHKIRAHVPTEGES